MVVRFPVDAECGRACGEVAQVTVRIDRAIDWATYSKLLARVEDAVAEEFGAFDIDVSGWCRQTHEHATL